MQDRVEASEDALSLAQQEGPCRQQSPSRPRGPVIVACVAVGFAVERLRLVVKRLQNDSATDSKSCGASSRPEAHREPSAPARRLTGTPGPRLARDSPANGAGAEDGQGPLPKHLDPNRLGANLASARACASKFAPQHAGPRVLLMFTLPFADTAAAGGGTTTMRPPQRAGATSHVAHLASASASASQPQPVPYPNHCAW
jgi:hypothetical protein